jgi:hypothetical protein
VKGVHSVRWILQMRREAALHLNSILYQNYKICSQITCGRYAKSRTFSNQSVIG